MSGVIITIMANSKILLSVILFNFINLSASDRILAVFSYPSLSRQLQYRSYISELLQRGHELVVVTPDPVYPNGNGPPNLLEINVHDVSYKAWKANLEDIVKNPHANIDHAIAEKLHRIFMLQFKSEGFQKIINDNRIFDLIILEAGVHSNTIVSYIFKAPVLIVGYGGYSKMDLTSQELIYPSALRQKTMNSTFWEIYNIYKERSLRNLREELEDVQNESFKSVVGYSIPTVRDLFKNIDMRLVNQFSIWEGIRPMPLNVVQLGRSNAQVKSVQQLPQDLQNYLNSSKNGVIYINFASIAEISLLTEDKVKTLIDALSKLPYNVLWRWDEEKLPTKSSNIKVMEEIPQPDVLSHPKIKVFISHADWESVDDAISTGVPVIGVPVLGAQVINADNFDRFNIGVKIDFDSLTEDTLEAAIITVISDKGYRDNIVHLRQLLLDQPQSPLNSAISWTEYALKHNGVKHLESPDSNMHWMEYLQLELVFTILLFICMSLTLPFLLCYVIYKVFRRCYRKYTYRRLMHGMHLSR